MKIEIVVELKIGTVVEYYNDFYWDKGTLVGYCENQICIFDEKFDYVGKKHIKWFDFCMVRSVMDHCNDCQYCGQEWCGDQDDRLYTCNLIDKVINETEYGQSIQTIPNWCPDRTEYVKDIIPNKNKIFTTYNHGDVTYFDYRNNQFIFLSEFKDGKQYILYTDGYGVDENGIRIIKGIKNG